MYFLSFISSLRHSASSFWDKTLAMWTCSLETPKSPQLANSVPAQRFVLIYLVLILAVHLHYKEEIIFEFILSQRKKGGIALLIGFSRGAAYGLDNVTS